MTRTWFIVPMVLLFLTQALVNFGKALFLTTPIFYNPRLEKQFRIVPLPKWVWLLGPKRFYEPFRRLTSVTMESLISQLNLKVGTVKFEFLLQKLNEAWKTLENIVKGFLCALASTGTNVEMMVRVGFITSHLWNFQGQLNEKHFEIEANVRILRVGMQKSESGKVKWSFGVKDCQIYLESVQLLPFSLGEFEFRDRFESSTTVFCFLSLFETYYKDSARPERRKFVQFWKICHSMMSTCSTTHWEKLYKTAFHCSHSIVTFQVPFHSSMLDV